MPEKCVNYDLTHHFLDDRASVSYRPTNNIVLEHELSLCVEPILLRMAPLCATTLYNPTTATSFAPTGILLSTSELLHWQSI